jgi:hypothetical protein
MGLEQHFSNRVVSGGVYVETWYPTMAVIGVVMPQDFEPKDFYKVQISKVDTDDRWVIQEFYRPFLDLTWASISSETARTRWGARRKAWKRLKRVC